MFITPAWPAPKTIKAYTTLRSGGVSETPFDHFNLAQHVGDTMQHVSENRALLKKILNLPSEPIWLQQTHSTHALPALFQNKDQEADAAFSQQPHQICVVLTADCLPILLCNSEGTAVAAVHAGWRGLLNGVIESTLKGLNASGNTWLAWLGPAISQSHFEVGHEVRDQFIAKNSTAETAFIPSPQGRWFADLYALARLRLQQSGITAIFGGDLCTYSDPLRFYSYRRDGNKTGRMATLIWISD